MNDEVLIVYEKAKDLYRRRVEVFMKTWKTCVRRYVFIRNTEHLCKTLCFHEEHCKTYVKHYVLIRTWKTYVKHYVFIRNMEEPM